MRKTLFALSAPDWPIAFAILALEIVLVAIWLVVLRRKTLFTTDHLYTGTALVGMTAVVLAILLKIGHLDIKAWGAMLMLGFMAGIYVATRLARRRGVPGERLIDLGMVILVGALLGARIAFVIMTPNTPFFDLKDVLTYGLGGMSFHGGLIGGFLAGSAYLVLTRISYWRVADCVAPSIALGYAITRIGCFLNGCCYGKPTDHPWGMQFPDSPDWFARVNTVHPDQLYASAMGFAIFIVLLLLSRGKSLGRAGRLFMVLLVLEGIERFTMEFFRHPDPKFDGLLTPAQWVSIALFLIGIIGFYLLPKRPAVVEPVAMPEAVVKN
ncbi:MAG: prolipoprotein diacylglyceryl transferase [Armatimonadota bacterium]